MLSTVGNAIVELVSKIDTLLHQATAGRNGGDVFPTLQTTVLPLDGETQRRVGTLGLRVDSYFSELEGANFGIQRQLLAMLGLSFVHF